MIRIKTVSFRQATERMFFYIMIFVSIFLTVFFSVIIMYFLKDDFLESLTDEITYSEEVFSKSMFVNNVIDNELTMFSFVDEFEDNDLFYASNEDELEFSGVSEIESVNDNAVEVINVNNVFPESSTNIEVKELPNFKYSLPKKFEVSSYSKGKIQVGNTKINNYSKLDLDLAELSRPKSIKLDGNTDFLIFHTHATESYTVDSSEVSNYRSTNESYNMISIGNSLVSELSMRGFNCLHDTILHDYPSYNGAYKHSLETVSKYLKSKDFEFVFDVHRDAISSDLTYGPVCDVGEEKAAQLMFVIGTDAAGVSHDEWMENLRLAVMIQNRANEMYPGLFRDINLSSSRYNQHVSNGACIIEVGTTGNTIDEAKTAMRFLANVLESFK